MWPERRRFLSQSIAQFFVALALVRTASAESRVITPVIESPERAVRDFLKMHFASTREFTARGLDRKERLFTRRFRKSLYKYFDKVRESDAKSPLVNDPFTGSQRATSYSVGDAKVRVEKAWVPVGFTDGSNNWTVTYLMRNDQERNDERWRLDDIQDRTGLLLTAALKK